MTDTTSSLGPGPRGDLVSHFTVKTLHGDEFS